MTSFWSISVFWIAVLLFVAIALAFVLPPLLRSGKRHGVEAAAANVAIHRARLAELEADLRNGTLSPDQVADARRDIEEQLTQELPANSPGGTGDASGRWAGFVLAGIVPVAAVGLYLVLGSPNHLVPATATAVAPGEQHDPAAMVAALEDKLKQHPDDGAGWAMLGRSYVALGRSRDGAAALARAAALAPGDASLLSDYAEAVALTQNRNMAGMPSALVARALAVNAKDEKALMLAGVAASQREDFAQAAAYWRRLLAVTPQDSELAGQVSAAIAKAEAQAAQGGRPAAAAAVAAPSGNSISGTVTISGALAAQLSPSDSVFIFAQAPQGPPMPLAVQRITASQLPYRFTLDDSMSMAAGNRLSSHPEVVVTARVSRSGEALPRSGDLQGRSGPVQLGRRDIALSIDTVVP